MHTAWAAVAASLQPGAPVLDRFTGDETEGLPDGMRTGLSDLMGLT